MVTRVAGLNARADSSEPPNLVWSKVEIPEKKGRAGKCEGRTLSEEMGGHGRGTQAPSDRLTQAYHSLVWMI